MDPAIIGYSKSKTSGRHEHIDEKQFGDYFIGSNKENTDTANDPPQDESSGMKGISHHDMLGLQSNLNKLESKDLTPLNTNTKLQLSPKKVVMCKLPSKKKAYDTLYDLKGLPSLPPTPSPPRFSRQRNKQYQAPSVEPLDHQQNPNHFSRYPEPARAQPKHYHHPQQSSSYHDYPGASREPTHSRNHLSTSSRHCGGGSSSGSYYANHNHTANGSSRFARQPYYHNTSSTGYSSHRSNSRAAFRDGSHGTAYDGYGKFAQRAPRFQALKPTRDSREHHGRGGGICKYWSKGAVCQNGDDCQWSHSAGYDESRKRVTNYKTKPCVDPGRGLKCEYDDRCNFAHPGEALRRPMPIEYSDRQYFKLLLRDCATNRYPFGIFV